LARLRGDGRISQRPLENDFITFVDQIFTTLVERLFTNAFDTTGKVLAMSCV
jgi:hypothetical protein